MASSIMMMTIHPNQLILSAFYQNQKYFISVVIVRTKGSCIISSIVLVQSHCFHKGSSRQPLSKKKSIAQWLVNIEKHLAAKCPAISFQS